jgi:cytochrome c
MNQKFKIPALALVLSVSIAIVAIIFADVFYRPKKMVKRGFEVQVSLDGKPIAKMAEKPIDINQLLRTANFDNGAKVFKKCASCHTIGKGEAPKVGPNLFGVVGRKKAATAFNYSEAMKAKGGAWDVESISQFITKPKDYVPGTKMAFPGLKKPQDRADVILYLQRGGK